MEICHDANTSPADLNKVISLDPVLTGKVMQLVNSAYFGLPQQIVSLVRAIVMLGMNTVKNLALSTAVLNLLGNHKNYQALNMDGFWKHSLAVGVISKLLAKKCSPDHKYLEEYFIAGLLHDIGKIPLNSKFSEEYTLAMEGSDTTHQSLFLSEKQIFGIDHTQVGKLIAQNWKLGTEITDAIGYHHLPETYEGEGKDMLYTVILADYFANNSEIGFSGNRYMEELRPDVVHHLDASTKIIHEGLEELTDEVNQDIEKAQIFLKIG